MWNRWLPTEAKGFLEKDMEPRREGKTDLYEGTIGRPLVMSIAREGPACESELFINTVWSS
jgi:hypothetical protein